MSTNHAAWGMNYSPTFRQLADAAVARASADLDNPRLGKHRGADGEPLTYTPCAAEAVILSVAALEAGINEMFTFLEQGFAPETPILPARDDFMKMRLTDKWERLPQAMVQRGFDRGTQPWQDFSALVGLRDALVHFKWRSEQVPNFMRSLQARDLTIPDSPAIYWVDAALTDRVAAWAAASASRMFEALASLLGKTDPLSWPWQ